jgi:hypothetical protein
VGKPEKQTGRPMAARFEKKGPESAPQPLLMAVVLRALTALVLVHLQTTLLLEASHGVVMARI